MSRELRPFPVRVAEIKQAAAVLNVVLHDHLIIGNGRYLSFRREGLL